MAFSGDREFVENEPCSGKSSTEKNYENIVKVHLLF